MESNPANLQQDYCSASVLIRQLSVITVIVQHSVATVDEVIPNRPQAVQTRSVDIKSVYVVFVDVRQSVAYNPALTFVFLASNFIYELRTYFICITVVESVNNQCFSAVR